MSASDHLSPLQFPGEQKDTSDEHLMSQLRWKAWTTKHGEQA